MKELSLNILDIAQNSITAGAKLTEITIQETEEQMIISVSDNGCGMSKELLASVTDPFCTTRNDHDGGLFQKSCGLHAARRHRFDAVHAVSELPRL